jgi:hypothetical protein
MAEGASKRVTVTVKTPKERKDIEADEDSTIESVNKTFYKVTGKKNISQHYLLFFLV